eukprot:GFYU01007244.1.p1 GENE.GFYU01007244.1~~GFYU01007244.1.p1  ORF type:complete len:635 (-),score=92.00 GFYU01007244.1:232-2136(-)
MSNPNLLSPSFQPRGLGPTPDPTPPRDSTSDDVHVAVRVRPTLHQGEDNVWSTSNRTISLSRLDAASPGSRPVSPARHRGSGIHNFGFDCVFDDDCTNNNVYNSFVSGIVEDCMEGYNGTILAYGQTASGKTHTILGDKNRPGLLPRAIDGIFENIKDTRDREYLLRMSYVEIYNESVNDLLDPRNVNLKIKESEDGFMTGTNTREEIVVSPEQVLKLIQVAEGNRRYSATDYNESSSRSHTIFRMVIESRLLPAGDSNQSKHIPMSPRTETLKPLDGSTVRVSCLSMVDLAGSERAGTVSARIRETSYINKSLLTLGNVISKLTEHSRGHIPYRDSKLTRLLQSSLGGNAKIRIICCINPTSSTLDESLNTLKFASRAKNMRNHAIVNEMVPEQTMMKQYESQISDLKQQLSEVQKESLNRGPSYEELEYWIDQKHKVEEDKNRMAQQLEEQQEEKVALGEKITRLQGLLLVSSSVPLRDGAKSPCISDPEESEAQSRRHLRRYSLAVDLTNNRRYSDESDADNVMSKQALTNRLRESIGESRGGLLRKRSSKEDSLMSGTETPLSHSGSLLFGQLPLDDVYEYLQNREDFIKRWRTEFRSGVTTHKRLVEENERLAETLSSKLSKLKRLVEE